MLVKEVNRSAAVAWSPLAHRPKLFVSGTLAGTMNVDFDPTGKLEIFDLADSASSGSNDALEMPCIGATSTAERFHRLAWKNLLPDVYQHGIIAGGFGSGTINIWNPTPLIEKTGADPLIASVQSHSGPVKALDFNPLQPTLLASGGPNGEVLIWNLANPSKPSVHTPGNAPPSPNSPEITSVAFHPRHRHILAASSNNGTTVIWDLREKRPTFSFSDPNRNFRCRSIAWHPEQPMQIATASDDDEAPLIHLWDLHLTLAPSTSLKGHQRGVMSIGWCQADKSIMVSTGKDNRTLCWDVASSCLITEIGSSTNWNLDVQWSPKIPTMLSTCSLDGKVRIYSVHDFENQPTPQSTQIANQKLHQMNSKGQNSSQQNTEDDIFNVKAGTSAHQSVSSSSILHAARQLENGAKIPARPPSWLRRPCGVSFGFGGKLVSFGKIVAQQQEATAASATSISVWHISQESDLGERADRLDQAVQSGDLKTFCDQKLSTLSSKQAEERDAWGFLASLFQSKPRQEILSFLNYDSEAVSAKVNEYLRTLPTPPGMLEEVEPEPELANGSGGHNGPNGSNGPHDRSSNTSPLPTPVDLDLFGSDDLGSEDSFRIPQSSIDAEAKKMDSAVKSSEVLPKKKPANFGPPVHFGTNDVSESMLTEALLVSDFEAAVECCVRLGKMADALVIAACGGKELWNHTQNIFFRQNKEKPYITLISSIANKDLETLIARVDLACWKEVLAILCSYSPNEVFEQHCEALADRLTQAGQVSSATLCYICAGSVDKVTGIWLNASIHKSKHSQAAVSPQLEIQELMEKIVVFSAAVKMAESATSDIVLQQYTRYAEILANQGRFTTALSYLSKLQHITSDPKTPAAMATAILLDRVYYALPIQVAQQTYRGNAPALYQRSSQQQLHHQGGRNQAAHNQKGVNVQPKGMPSPFERVEHFPAQTGSWGFQRPNPNPKVVPKPVGRPTTAPTHVTPTASIYQPIGISPNPMAHHTPVGPGMMQQQGFHHNPGAGHLPPAASTGASFVPIAPSTFSSQPFVPQPVASNPQPFVPGPAAPPSGPSSKGPVIKARVPVSVPSFVPSASAPAPLTTAQPVSSKPADPVKKKKKKTSPVVPAPTSAVGSILPPTPSAAPIATYTAPPAAYSHSAGPTQSMPAPKARPSRIQAPSFGPPAGHLAPASTAPPRPVAAVDPGTWNPQQPLPAHLTAGLGPANPVGPQQYTSFQPAPAANFQASTPGGFHPPPTGSFQPSTMQHGGFAPQTSQFPPTGQFPPTQTFQPMPPAPAAALPPPKPGRAKKETLATPTSTPTPVYVTGPQAEAAAALKEHEPSEEEIAALSTLVAVLDKIQATNDPSHPDLFERFNELKERIVNGTVPPAAVSALLVFAELMNTVRYKEAQDQHGELSRDFYHPIGSKAMLGLKRMLITVAKHKL